MALPLAPQALRLLLDEVARQRLPVMVFVGNAGVTQIYTGTIAGAAADSAGCVAQAPGVSLHLRDSALRSGYVVQRAGATSVEFFGPDGEPVVTFIGVRDRAKPLAWGELVRRLAGHAPGLPPAKP
jgi:putative hemin transport protein